MRTDNPVDIARKQLAADLALDVRRCDSELKVLRDRIDEAVDASGTTLLEIYGVGPIVAALILGYSGGPARFPTKEKFASYNGTAPIEASSDPKARHRCRQSVLLLGVGARSSRHQSVRRSWSCVPGTDGRARTTRRRPRGQVTRSLAIPTWYPSCAPSARG